MRKAEQVKIDIRRRQVSRFGGTCSNCKSDIHYQNAISASDDQDLNLELLEVCTLDGSSQYLADKIYAARRERRHFFNSALFSEPAWDMLLAIFRDRLRGLDLSVTSVVLASDAPYTTGLRWLRILEEEGLVARSPHRSDARSELVQLTAEGLSKMEAYLQRLRAKSRTTSGSICSPRAWRS